MKKPDLKALRAKIDAIDTRLIKLLNDRTKLVLEVGELKNRTGREIYAPDREDAVLRRIVARSNRMVSSIACSTSQICSPKRCTTSHTRNSASRYRMCWPTVSSIR